jgi:hypothetical protein
MLSMVYTAVIPTLGRLKWEEPKFEASLGYIAKPCLKKNFLTFQQKTLLWK